MSSDPYATRPMSALFPDLELRGAEFHAQHHESGALYTPMVISCLERLIDLGAAPGPAVVLGCGPRPRAAMALAARGFDVHGIEPVPANVEQATTFCGSAVRVVQGSGERMPIPSGSQRLVLMESVLEHVDSVPLSLAEVFRVLAPGGVAYVYTTNRHKLSWRGFNGEFSVPFLNWFPRLVRECYVHDQLHFRPALANFNARPAVHWFSYADLCAAGRDAGFARFYSLLDLVPVDSAWANGPLRRLFLPLVRRRPWLRAAALTQSGGSIFMIKRQD